MSVKSSLVVRKPLLWSEIEESSVEEGSVWFHQDGAPCHAALVVIDHVIVVSF